MTTKNVNLDQIKAACSRCSLADLCLPHGLTEAESQRLDTLINKRVILHKGDYVFREGDKFDGIIAVRTGSFKGYKIGSHANEQILGFFLPGELLGFDAVNTETYNFSAVALDTSSICKIPFDKLLEFAREIPSLQRHLFSLIGKPKGQEFSYSNNTSADERLALFLLSLSSRFKQRGYSAAEFSLSMSRQDIGHYLGLATETISRLFKKMQEANIIDADRREIKIIDLPALQAQACHPVDLDQGNKI